MGVLGLCRWVEPSLKYYKSDRVLGYDVTTFPSCVCKVGDCIINDDVILRVYILRGSIQRRTCFVYFVAYITYCFVVFVVFA